MAQKLFSQLDTLSHSLMKGKTTLGADRRNLLNSIAEAIARQNGPIYLNFICVHNSRRSMISQAWAQVAAFYHEVPGITCVSGGTEVTAFHPNAVNVLRRQGFHIEIKSVGPNPVYGVSYAADAPPLEMFSKLFDVSVPAGKPFMAMMVCSTADSWCPVVPGATARFQFNYSDPGASDGSAFEESVYDQRAEQIATEMLYLFSKVKIGQN